MSTLSAYEQGNVSLLQMNKKEVIQRFLTFSRRNQIMRYITVEDLSFYYDKRACPRSTSTTVLIVGSLSTVKMAAKTTLILEASLEIILP